MRKNAVQHRLSKEVCDRKTWRSANLPHHHSSCQENLLQGGSPALHFLPVKLCSSVHSPKPQFLSGKLLQDRLSTVAPSVRKTAPVQALPSYSFSIEFSMQKSNATFSSPQATWKLFFFSFFSSSYSLCKTCESTIPQPPSLGTLFRTLPLSHFLICFPSHPCSALPFVLTEVPAAFTDCPPSWDPLEPPGTI